MYLSKVNLDLRSASVRQALRDCGDMHRNIQKLFSASRSDSGVVYRVYQQESGCCVYTMSETAPVETEESIRNGMRVTGSRDVSAMEELFVPGKRFRFQLLTMPYKKVADGVSKNSRRRYLRTPEERMAWLQRKGEQYGFEILDMEEQPGETLSSYKNGHMLYLSTVKYSGVLCVTEQESFCRAWKYGIGAEKAYGLGMLMVQ